MRGHFKDRLGCACLCARGGKEIQPRVRHVSGARRIQARELVKDNRMMTEMERGDGVLPSVSRARGRGRFNTAELSSLFRAAVMPSQLERTSRQGYFASWRTVVTWLLAHDAADQGLPMSKALLEARGTNHGAPPNRVVRRKHSQHLECYREPTQDVRP